MTQISSGNWPFGSAAPIVYTVTNPNNNVALERDLHESRNSFLFHDMGTRRLVRFHSDRVVIPLSIIYSGVPFKLIVVPAGVAQSG